MSHIIPKFVYRELKADSPTGYFRNPNNPNRRFQDGDKMEIMCWNCEQRFSIAESEVASDIYAPFHTNDRCEFTYSPAFHYFLTSLAWRTLILDLPSLESNAENPAVTIERLKAAAESMRCYLLGSTNIGCSLRNHAFFWNNPNCGPDSVAPIGPNVLIRRSVFGFVVIDQDYGYAGILHNLAGMLCFFIVKGRPNDVWQGTKVDPHGGRMKQPQHINSWLAAELLECIGESAQKRAAISNRQLERIGEGIQRNPNAAGRRFSEWDKRNRGE